MDIKQNVLDIRGSLVVPDEAAPGEVKKVVFQGTAPQFANYRTGTGQPRMIRAHVIPADPRTPAQINQRTKMTMAVSAWHESTQAERLAFAETAKARGITVYMAFVSSYIKALPPLLGTVWDGGTTAWIDGSTTTLWDI